MKSFSDFKCNGCGEIKDIADYEFRKDRGVYRDTCKDCRKEARVMRQKKYRQTDKYKAQNRARHKKNVIEMSECYLKKKICERSNLKFNQVDFTALEFQKKILTIIRTK